MVKGHINKVIPFSSVDGPGNRTAIFLQGCNFNCIYCHNPETINGCEACGKCVGTCPEGILTKEVSHITWDKDKCQECDRCIKACTKNSSPKVLTLTADQLLEGIEPYKGFIQGITVSGGECTLQETFLIDLFKKAKVMGFTCFIDTNGSIDFEHMETLLDLTDGVMLDVKAWDEVTHKKYIGVTNTTVKKNLNYLLQKNKLYEVRTVVVPGVFDNEETVEAVSKVLGAVSETIRYKLIKFRPLGVREEAKNIAVPSTLQMEALANTARLNGCKEICII